MPKYERNAGRHWNDREIRALKQMVRQNTPTRVIGLKLGRPVAGIYAKASEEGVSLRPTNQSPYGRSRA